MIHNTKQQKSHPTTSLILMLAIWMIINVPNSIAQNKSANQLKKCNTEVRITSVKHSTHADSLYADFKLMQNGKKTFKPDILKKNVKEIFEVNEVGSSEKFKPVIDTLLDIRNKKSIADNLSILFLIDRSITMPEDFLEEIFKMMSDVIRALPDTKKYISFMENSTVTTTAKLDSASWEGSIRSGFNETSGEKDLYKSILSKLEELSGEKQTYYPGTESQLFKNNNDAYMIFVFTDGQLKNKNKEYYGGDIEYFQHKNEYIAREIAVNKGEKKKIPIHCVYLGDKSLDEEIIEGLQALCSKVGNDDERGKFYDRISPDTLNQVIMGTIDSLAADYRLVLLNPQGKMYDGTPLNLQVYIKDGKGIPWASGEKTYAFGSPQLPIRVTDVSPWTIVLIGLSLGLALIGITYVILQFLVPAIRYERFLKKYVVPYSASRSGYVEQKCYYCKEPFVEGDIVVTKCEHVVHKECWDENHNRCPEYGRHKCKTGIHYYNQSKKTDPKNATHFLPWILAGFVAGLMSWLCFRLFNAINLFGPMMESIASNLYPFEGAVDESVIARAMTKTSQWLQAGISLGFFIVLAFSYVLEFRKVDSKVLGNLLLRALVGAIAGFVAFLLGGIIVILCGIENTCWWIDWIPWLLFALAVSVVLWYKSEIKLKSALTGGAISVLFSFIVMFVLTGTVTSLFSYMLYAAGLGGAIAVVHYASEKYFLRIDGCVKERDIAIYKWMSVTGGFNKVSIGKSPQCVLQMNWDTSEGICDRVVELYLENDRPYCKVLDNGVTQQGRTMPRGTTLLLTHGSEFTIGKTRFTYIEKDA